MKRIILSSIKKLNPLKKLKIFQYPIKRYYSQKTDDEILKDMEQIKKIHSSNIYKIMQSESPEKLIKLILEKKLTNIDEIRFSFLYLSSFKLNDLKISKQEISQLIHIFISNINNFCDDSNNFCFFFHIISKIYNETGVIINLDILSDFLNKNSTSILLEQLNSEDLIHFSNYLEKIYKTEIMEFYHFFNYRIQPLIKKNLHNYKMGDILTLLSIMYRSKNKDISFINEIIDQMGDFKKYDRKEIMDFLFFINNLGFKEEEFTNYLLYEILKEYSNLEKIDNDLVNDNSYEQQLLKSKEEELKKTIDPMKKIELTEEIEIRKEELLKRHKEGYTQDRIEDNFDVSIYIELLHISIDTVPKSLDVIKEILFRINEKIKDLDKDYYIDLWNCIALIKKRNIKLSVVPFLKSLKKYGIQNKNLSLKNYQAKDLNGIFVSLASMKDNDQKFVHVVLNLLLPKINELTDLELVQLFISFFVYSNIFENYYLIIHKELVMRMDSLDMNHLKMIEKVLRLKKDLFSYSPLMKILNIVPN